MTRTKKSIKESIIKSINNKDGYSEACSGAYRINVRALGVYIPRSFFNNQSFLNT
jgi:hypothetical protein